MISLFLYLITSFFNVITANLLPKNSTTVFDIVHSTIPNIPLWSYTSDSLVLAQVVYTIAIIDQKTLSTLLLILGITKLFRIFCMASTVLPQLKKYEDKLRMGGLNGTGTEYIFSGHACYSAITFWYLFFSVSRESIPWLILFNIASQSLIIISRNHYTVDIILAWIITPLVYLNVYLCSHVEWCSTILHEIL